MKPDECICTDCDGDYETVIREICAQADYFGKESLTENQQAFLEMVERNEVPKLCPMCMD